MSVDFVRQAALLAFAAGSLLGVPVGTASFASVDDFLPVPRVSPEGDDSAAPVPGLPPPVRGF